MEGSGHAQTRWACLKNIESIQIPCHIDVWLFICLQAGVSSPKPYASVGLQYCGIDTTKAGTYTVTFTAANDNSASASVQRTVVVQPSCSSGEQACSDGTCGEGGGRGLLRRYHRRGPVLFTPLAPPFLHTADRSSYAFSCPSTMQRPSAAPPRPPPRGRSPSPSLYRHQGPRPH